MDTKIIITGANGQLGRELQNIAGLYPALQFIFTDVNELDITNHNACVEFVEKHRPHFLINCAAYTAVDKAEEDKNNATKINVDAVKNLTEACKQTGCALVHISTDYVFDGKNYRPYVETDETNPQSVYGETKLQGEKIALAYNKSMVIRTSWLYSAYGNNFVKTMLRLGNERKELNVVFDQIGTPTYAADLAKAILDIINKTVLGNKNFEPGIFHYSNEGVCSWYDFAQTIMQTAKIDCMVKPIETKDYPTAAKRPFYSVLNKSKIKFIFDIEIPHWEKSMQHCINILLQQK